VAAEARPRVVIMGDQGLDAAQGVDGSLLTTDSGVNTNPRRYEKDYGFVSDVVAVAVGPVATPIWAAGLPAVNPAAGRTAGLVTTIYSLVIENSTGAAVTAWLRWLVPRSPLRSMWRTTTRCWSTSRLA